jgi:hypothetical protein
MKIKESLNYCKIIPLTWANFLIHCTIAQKRENSISTRASI